MARPQATPESPGSRALVVDLIRSSGPISRVELTTATGLTQPAISLIVRKLLDDGVIVDAGTAPSTGGKPRRLLDMNRRARHGIGIQLGLESATFVATDTNGGVIARERLPGAGTEDPTMVITRLAAALRSFASAADIPPASVNGVALVVPGPMRMNPDVVIEAPSLPHWREVPVRAEFERALGMPVLVDNDASAAARGECWSRGVSRYHSFACIYIGSGVGAGVVVDGALFRGASSNAAEIGHIAVATDGPECFCGNYGCLEVMAAPRVMVQRGLAHPGIAARLRLDERATVAQNWEAISRAAVAEDPDAAELVTDGANAVGRAALTLTNLFDLDEIVLSGPGIATAGSIYVREVRTALRRSFARKTHLTTVDLSINPTDSAAIGAAALTLQGELAPGHGPALKFSGP